MSLQEFLWISWFTCLICQCSIILLWICSLFSLGLLPTNLIWTHCVIDFGSTQQFARNLLVSYRGESAEKQHVCVSVLPECWWRDSFVFKEQQGTEPRQRWMGRESASGLNITSSSLSPPPTAPPQTLSSHLDLKVPFLPSPIPLSKKRCQESYKINIPPSIWHKKCIIVK